MQVYTEFPSVCRCWVATCMCKVTLLGSLQYFQSGHESVPVPGHSDTQRLYECLVVFSPTLLLMRFHVITLSYNNHLHSSKVSTRSRVSWVNVLLDVLCMDMSPVLQAITYSRIQFYFWYCVARLHYITLFQNSPVQNMFLRVLEVFI